MEKLAEHTPRPPKVAVAVLNWHGREQTRACLDALGTLEYPDFHVVLVDNGCEEFRDRDFPTSPSISYLHSRDNLGFAGGCNLALERALANGADFIWFLNNDATPEADSLQTMVAAAEASGVGVLGAKILRACTDPPRIDSLAVAIDTTTGRFALVGHDQVDRGQYDSLARVDAVTGCAMLVRADVARALHGFDDRYFLYLEDLDLCLRARAAGESVAVVPGARVHHDRPASGSGRQSDDSLYYTCRNHFLLMATHGRGGSARRLIRTVTILALNLAFALLASPPRIPGRLRAVVAGARDYSAGKFGVRLSSP